jgi:hypothetical protein
LFKFAKLWVMRTLEAGWEPITEVPPSDTLVCNYDGPFAQHLELNRPVIDRFLSIASLDGRVLITDSKLKRPHATPDINPDGSVSSKGVLRWGEKPQVEPSKQNLYFQVNPDPKGWTIAINGSEIAEGLISNSNPDVRAIKEQFSRKTNHYLRIGLKESLLKEKCTTIKDPYLIGRIITSSCYVSWFFKDIPKQDWLGLGVDIAFYMALIINNHLHSLRPPGNDPEQEIPAPINLVNKVWDWNRRSLEHPLDTFGLPFEADRLILSYGYLDLQMLKRNSLIRAA